jgi:hypothetical protein
VSRDTDRTEALRRQFIRAIVEDTGVSETMAMPFANSIVAHLQREYASEKLYIPGPTRQYDVLQIRAALERGDSEARVRREHSISRSALYRLFPGGLPRKAG